MAPVLSYQPAPLMEEEDELQQGQDSESSSGPTARVSAHRHVLLASLGLGLPAALVMVLFVGGRPTGAPLAARMDAVTYLTEEDLDPCSRYPFIRLDEVIHSNLGGQGPDSGPEGMVYRAKDIVPEHPEMELLITVNASDAYQAGHASLNGIHGKYGLITIKPGNQADFIFKVLDPATRQAKDLLKQEITFFDLDQSASGDNEEFVEAKGFTNYWLTTNTEIVKSEVEGGKTKFMSSKPGTGADNPKDPTALTVQQKNRAVSLEYKDFNELQFTLGAGAGKWVRYFLFVLRPSLLCAKTTGAVEDGEDEVVGQLDTTLPPSTAVTTAAPAKSSDWFVIPLWKWQLGVPSFKFEAVS